MGTIRDVDDYRHYVHMSWKEYYRYLKDWTDEINWADPSENDNKALIEASTYGEIGILKVLLADPRVDSSANNNTALYRASGDPGHPNVVKLLLADPRVDTGDVIISASQRGNSEVVLVDPRVDHR